MRALSLALLFVFGLVAAAAAEDYTMANRPKVTFKGGTIHQSPYPQNSRQASVWNSDACWRDCTATCNAKMAGCMSANTSDACRPYLDACDRTCQRDCRGWWGGPFLGVVDW